MGSVNSFSADLALVETDAVVVLRGELDLASTPQLERVLDPLVSHGPPEIVLDCAALSFLDSSGIAVLVNVQSRLGQQDRQLIVRAPQANVLRVLEVTGLMDFLHVDSEVVQIHPDQLAV